MSATDWVGLWYKIAKEHGLNDVVSMARVDLQTGNVDWRDFSHSEMDAAGALAQWLREGGCDVPTPTPRHGENPSIFGKIRGLLCALFGFRGRRLTWRHAVVGWTRPELHAFPWIVFFPEETTAIREHAGHHGVSVSSYLLARLNGIAAPKLTAADTPSCWLFPVNMRGAVKKEVEFSNHSSAIVLRTRWKSEPPEIQEQINRQLRRNVHFGMWWMLNVGRIIGLSGMRRVWRLGEKKGQWLGTFTNLGQWPPSGAAPSDTAFVVTPPGFPNFPVSVGLLTYNGALSVSLKIHPSVHPEPGFAAQCLEQFKDSLMRDIGRRPQ